MNELKIRAAQEFDAEELTQLAMRSKAVWGYDETFMASCKDELSLSSSQINSELSICFTALVNSKLVGFYLVTQQTSLSEEAELEALFVEPEFLGHGIGKKLFDHIICQCQQKGINKLHIQADPNAEAFYLKVGAELIGKTASMSIKDRYLPQFVYNLT